MHFLLLHQATGLLQGGVGIRAVILDIDLDIAAGDLQAVLLPEQVPAVLHFLARCGGRSRQGTQKSDPDRPFGREDPWSQGWHGQYRTQLGAANDECPAIHFCLL